MSDQIAIAPCACGALPPRVWIYDQHDPLRGTVQWHVLCKACRAEVVMYTKLRALRAWDEVSAKRTRPAEQAMAQ